MKGSDRCAPAGAAREGRIVSVFTFIDTNVLLHYDFFADVDWAAQLGVDDVKLVFAPVVLSELDRHKWSGSRREKARAKAVLKKLDSLGLSTTPVTVRTGVAAMAGVGARILILPQSNRRWPGHRDCPTSTISA